MNQNEVLTIRLERVAKNAPLSRAVSLQIMRQNYIKIVIIALFLAGLATDTVSASERQATEHNEHCLPVKREIFRLKHWQWSGIFPFEGGFIPDPHFVCSSTASFPSTVAALLNDSSAVFQIVDVNPFFEDKSKEIILAIQSSDKILYELKFDYLLNFKVRQAMAESYPAVRVFTYKGKIALLSHLDTDLRGYYFISLPLKSSDIMQLHPIGSEEFEKVTEYFRNLPPSTELKDYFCGRGIYDGTGSNAFIAYYQKYRGDCDYKYDPRNQTDYEQWWGPAQ
jgi:hypothetical protein